MHVVYASMLFIAKGSPSLPDNSLKIAIVTAISVVLAAAITGFATTRHRSSNDSDDGASQTFITELLRRAEVADRHIEALEVQRDQQAARVDELERYCWQAGVDPFTGEKLHRDYRSQGGA